MIDFIKCNLVSFIVLVVLAIALVGGNDVALGAQDRTTVTNPWTFQEDVIIDSDDFVINGATTTVKKTTSLNSATTTICALQSPAATSTLSDATIRLSVSSTTASTLTFAKDSDGNGSSTPFHAVSVAAGAQVTADLLATTTTAGVLNYTFGPSEYFTVTMAGTPGTFSPTGVCQAVFVSI